MYTDFWGRSRKFSGIFLYFLDFFAMNSRISGKIKAYGERENALAEGLPREWFGRFPKAKALSQSSGKGP